MASRRLAPEPPVRVPPAWPPGDGKASALVRGFDWGATPLGASADWDPRLQAVVELVLASPLVASVAVGPERRLIYNDVAARLYGARHPGALGQPLATAFADSYPAVAGRYDRVFAGESVTVAGQALSVSGPVDDGGGGEVFDAYLTPVCDASGTVIAAHMTGFEVGAQRRAAAALAASEARHRLLFGSVTQAVWETDPDGVVVTDSPSWRAYTGQTLAEWLGYGRLDAIHPDDRAYAERQWRAAVAARGLVDAEFRLRARDGGWRWTNVRAAPVLDAGGDVVKWGGLNIDIDVRKQAEAALRAAEARQGFLLRLADALRPLSDPVAVQDATARALGSELAVDRCYYAEFDWPADVLHIQREYTRGDAVSAIGSHPISAFQDLLRFSSEGVPLVCDDVAVHPLFRREAAAYRARGTCGFVLVPLVKDGVMVACMCVTMEGPRHWSEAEVALVAKVAERTWDAVQRARAEAALADSEARYRLLFEAIDEGFCLCEQVPGEPVDFRYLMVNPAFARQSGLTDPVGRTLRELVPGIEEATVATYARVVATGVAEQFTAHVAELDHWYEVEAIPGDRPGRVAMLFRNVTERRRAEEALRESEERQAFLLTLSDALRPLSGADEIQRVAARLAAEHWGMAGANYVRIETRQGVPYAIVRQSYVAEGREAINGDYPLADFPAFTSRMLAGEKLIVSQVAGDPDLTERDKANWKAMDIATVLSVSLLKGGDLVACFAVHGPRPKPWTIADADLLEEIAERTWAAVERSRAETELRQREAELARTQRIGQVASLHVELSDPPVGHRSPEYCRLHGLPPDCALESHDEWLARIHPDDREREDAEFHEAVAGGDTLDSEYRIKRQDTGEVRWIESRGVVERDADGRALRLLGAHIDITERKQAEAALRQSEERYRTLFESMDEAYAVVEVLKDGTGRWADFRFLAVNPAFMVHTDMPYPLGRTATELLGTPNPRWTELCGQALDTGEPLRVEEGEAALGKVFDLNIFAVDRGRNRVAVLFTDITERKRAEAALRASEERQRFLLALADALRPLTDSAELERTAVTMLGERLGADHVFYASIAPDAERWSIEQDYVRDGPSSAGSYGFSDYQRKRLPQWRSGALSSVADSETDETLSEADRASYAAFGARAAIGVPLVRGGRFAALLVANSKAPRAWTEAELALVREVAERTWIAIEGARTAEALRASEERQRLMLQLVPVLLWEADPHGREIVLTDRWQEFTGQSEAESRDFGWLDAIHPDDLIATKAAFEHAFATGEPLERQQRIHLGGDGYRWHLVRHVPVRDEDGTIVRWFGAAVDIHASVLAAQARDESERRLQTLVRGVPQLVWRAGRPGDWTWASPQWTEFTGQSEADSHGTGWLDPVHPDDRERVRERWSQAVAEGEFSANYRICSQLEGRYRWFQTRATPVRTADGQIVEWLGTSTDVEDLRAMQDRLRLLVAELQHRVRNILTVVRSVFGRTVEAGGEVEEIADHFRGRLDALARTQVVMTSTASGEVNLEDLIREELLSVGFADGPRVTISGPEIWLPAKTGETIGLAIHELTTNAVKYGALLVPRGSLKIQWLINIDDSGHRRLIINWVEQGVPLVAVKPARYGFGSELIEEALPYRLGGETKLEFQGGGVRCTITIPLSDPDDYNDA